MAVARAVINFIRDEGYLEMARQKMEATVRNSFSSADPSDFPEETFSQMLALAGIRGTWLPKHMAEINEILNALQAEFRAILLTEFVNELFRYQTEQTGRWR